MSGTRCTWVYAVFMTVAVLVMFREFFFSSMDLIAGNLGDSRFVIFILEHWRNVFTGAAAWRSPPLFFPEQGALGYSEALFLFSIPFAIFRTFGIDIYLSFEWTLVLLRAVGMIGFALVLRQVFGISHLLSAFGAALYGVLSSIYLKVGHSQMLAIDLIPLLLFLLHRWVSARPSGAPRWISGTVLALWLPLMFSTSYNVSWMATLCALLTLTAAMGHREFRNRVSRIPAFLKARKVQLAVLTAVFVLSWVPFFLTYLPVYAQFGRRSFKEVRIYLPQWLDIINVGQMNLIWGGALDGIFDWKQPRIWHEVNSGLTPVLLVVFLATLGWALARLWRAKRGGGALEADTLWAAILGIGAILTWLSIAKFPHYTAWRTLYDLVPGAGAIRAVGRMQLILGLPVLAVTLIGLNWSVRRVGRLASPTWRFAGLWLAIPGLCVLLFVEQLTAEPTHSLNRAEDMAYLGSIGPPPSSCQAFFIETNALDRRPNYAWQVDAMLIAQRYGLSTVNGHSGQWPRGYSPAIYALDPNAYDRAVRDWLAFKQVERSVCRLRLPDGTWTEAGASALTQ